MSVSLASEQAPLVFRLNENGLGPDLLRQVFLERGWSEFDEDSQYHYEWNLWWRTSRFRTSDYDCIYPWQRLNHYPKSTLITKKDGLARNLKRMQCVHGASIFNFSPLSFNLPNDYTKYVKAYGALRQKGDGRVPLWICKPADLSRGRGIFIFRDLSELMYDCNAVVQLYIENPLLIGGYKFDLRIYVAVISFQPLRVYIHEEGIARFSTAKFDLNCPKNVFAHLTNTSINKHSPGYTEDKERVGPGCKWTLTQLRHYFLNSNINDNMLWRRIINIVVLTLLVQAPQVQKVDNCFELYGFDIIIDENIKPWLLEVNFSPSLGSDCQPDVIAKKPMLHDLFDLLHFKAKDAERGGEDFQLYYRHMTGHDAYGQRNNSLGGQKGGGGIRKNQRRSRQGRHSAKATTESLSVLGPQRAHNNASALQQHGRDLSSSVEDVSKEVEGTPDARRIHQRGTDPRKNNGAVVKTGSGDSGGMQRRSGGKETLSGDSVTVPGAGRNFVEEALDSVVNQALADCRNSVNPEYRSPSLPLGKNSAESHNSGASGDSKVSKVSADSGFASSYGGGGSSDEPPGIKERDRGRQQHDSKSLEHSAKSRTGSRFGSLPEVRTGSQIGSSSVASRRDRDDSSLHLPSLENSASSKQSRRSKKSVLTPRSTADSVNENVYTPDRDVVDDDLSDLSRSRTKSLSTKSLLNIGSGSSQQRRNRSEDCSYPMTNRSVASVSGASVKSGAGSTVRRPLHHRTNSSFSQHGNLSKFVLPPSRQASRSSALHGGFSSLVKKMGDFHLVFPFNEATHKVSQGNLDPKVVIRETQRLVKESLNAVSISRAGMDHSQFGTETDWLWAPLRPPKED